MAIGKFLGSVYPTSTAFITVYTVPTSTFATFNILINNHSSTSRQIDVAIGLTATPADKDYIFKTLAVPLNGTVELTSLVASAGERVIVKASFANIFSVRVHGFEEAV